MQQVCKIAYYQACDRFVYQNRSVAGIKSGYKGWSQDCPSTKFSYGLELFGFSYFWCTKYVLVHQFLYILTKTAYFNHVDISASFKIFNKTTFNVRLPYGGKLWWQKNLVNSLEKHIGRRKFGKFSPFSKQNLLYHNLL